MAAKCEQEAFSSKFALIEKSSFREIAGRYNDTLRKYLAIDRRKDASPAVASNQDACKKLYWKLAKLTHPDANSKDSPELRAEKEKIFKDAVEAYDKNDLDGLMLQLLLVPDNQAFAGEPTLESFEVVSTKLWAKAQQIFSQAAEIGMMDQGEFYNYLDACIEFMNKTMAEREAVSLFRYDLPGLGNS